MSMDLCVFFCGPAKKPSSSAPKGGKKRFVLNLFVFSKSSQAQFHSCFVFIAGDEQT